LTCEKLIDISTFSYIYM